MKIFVIILFTFINIQLNGQHYKIMGKVVDTSGAGLDHVSVILLDHKDSTMLGFTNSGNDGKFDLDYSFTGNYLIQFSYTGYESQWLKIEIDKNILQYNLGLISLKSRNYKLPVIEVKSERSPIRFGRDTVEYNASSFKTQAGDVVEDLLKKLPGVEVERDGSVKAYGEKVQNVLVDGKEFFGKDTRVATKNLEADAIDKVQIFDKKSEEAVFTGVDDGQKEKTINLQLKEDKKQGYFGNANAGAGTDERNATKFNLNKFSPSSRLSVIGNANNINEQGFSIQDYIDFMGGIGAFMSGSSSGRVRIELNDDSGIPLPGLGQIPGIQKSISGGFNYTKDLSSKTELNSSFFYNNISNTLNEQLLRQNISNSSYYITDENKNQYTKNANQSFNLYLKHRSDSTQNLTFRLNGGWSDASLDNSLHSISYQDPNQLLNDSKSSYHLDGNSYQFRSSLAWMKRIGKPGRSLTARLSAGLRNNAKDGNLHSQNYFYLLSNIADSTLQRQDLNDKSANYEVTASYTEPLGKKRYFELNASHSNYKHNTANDYFDILNNNQEEQNMALSKSYESNYSTNAAGLNLIFNKNKINVTAGFKWQISTLSGMLKANSLSGISNDYSRIFPALFGEYRIGTANHLNFEYQTFLQEPSIEQLQPIVDNSDPLNLYKGNPSLNPEYRHTINVNYFLYDQFNFTSFFTSMSGGYTLDKITDIIKIDSAFRRIIQPVNVPYEKNIRASLDFNTPIRPCKINFRIRLGAGASNGILYINDERNTVNRYRYNLNLSIENRNKENVDAIIGWKLSNNKTNYSVSSINNQQFRETGIYSDLNLTLSNKLSLKSNFEYRNYSSSSFQENISIPLWELSISRFFMKDNKLRLQLKVFDLLNENKGIRRTSQLNYIEEERSNVLGRYALIQIGYAIRGFSSKKNGIEIKLEN